MLVNEVLVLIILGRWVIPILIKAVLEYYVQPELTFLKAAKRIKKNLKINDLMLKSYFIVKDYSLISLRKEELRFVSCKMFFSV